MIHMYATRVQLLCTAYMLHVNNCTQTAYIYSYACMVCMRVALSQLLCMQHACNMDVLCVQHTCVTCAGVHICSMYAVYMPNMCMKVADTVYM